MRAKRIIFITILIFTLSIGYLTAYAIDPKKSDVILHIGDNRAQIDNSLIYIDEANKNIVPIIKNDRTLVPVRFIAERFSAEVLWDAGRKLVTINSGKNKINIKIGAKAINVNGKDKSIDTEATIINDRTYLPLRAICESLGKYVFYDSGIIIISNTSKEWTSDDTNRILNVFSYSIKYEKTNYNGAIVSVIKINPKDPSIKLEVALPDNKLNNTVIFSDIVGRMGAFAAINANFFNAYSEIKDPIGHVINEGKVTFGQSGLDSVLIMKNGDIKFTKPTINALGTTDNKKDNIYLGNGKFDYHQWAAYGINSLEQDLYSAMLYTRERGEKVSIKVKGYVIAVKDDIVIDKIYVEQPMDVNIPENGFVLFIGDEEEKLSLSAEAFKLGRTVQMKYRIVDENKNEINADEIKYALSGGPELVKNGIIVSEIPASFASDSRFTTAQNRRTAIGLDKTGKLMLVYVNKATIGELKNIMKDLGCTDAINLDGGASSGMFYNGNLIATPGRKLATILYVYFNK